MSRAELVAVVDPDPAARNRIATQCNTRPLDDHRRLIGRIDAAVIAAPTRLHHRLAMDLLEQGVHLLVEKPLCPNTAEADELVETADRRGLVLQVGHVEQFNPALAAALPPRAANRSTSRRSARADSASARPTWASCST